MKKKFEEYAKGTLICEKCGEPLETHNMSDELNPHKLIGYSHMCRACGYSIIEKA